MFSLIRLLNRVALTTMLNQGSLRNCRRSLQVSHKGDPQRKLKLTFSVSHQKSLWVCVCGLKKQMNIFSSHETFVNLRYSTMFS